MATRDEAGARRKGASISKSLSLTLWRWAYALEEARQAHAGAGRLFRQAGCCLALAALRLAGVWL